MFSNYVIPLFGRTGESEDFFMVLVIYGIGESAVEETIKDLLINQTMPTIAPLALVWRSYIEANGQM